jgi:hypothetical protein
LRRGHGSRSHGWPSGRTSFVTEITIAHPKLNFSLTPAEQCIQAFSRLPRARKTHYTRILAVDAIPM